MSDPDEPIVENEDTAPIPDAANPVAQQRLRRRQRKTQDEADQFWRGIFESVIGRREMWAILQNGHAFDTPFMATPTGFPDPNAEWHRAGESSYALRLYHSWMKTAPEGVMLMHRECDPRFQAAPKQARDV